MNVRSPGDRRTQGIKVLRAFFSENPFSIPGLLLHSLTHSLSTPLRKKYHDPFMDLLVSYHTLFPLQYFHRMFILVDNSGITSFHLAFFYFTHEYPIEKSSN